MGYHGQMTWSPDEFDRMMHLKSQMCPGEEKCTETFHEGDEVEVVHGKEWVPAVVVSAPHSRVIVKFNQPVLYSHHVHQTTITRTWFGTKKRTYNEDCVEMVTDTMTYGAAYVRYRRD